MLPLTLEIYDSNGTQYLPAFRNLRFTKDWQGGEDVSLGFVLDRSGCVDWPDVGYGYLLILRKGLTALWRGRIRGIEQDQETIAVTALGNWAYLDDFCYDNETTAAGTLTALAQAVLTKAIAMGAPLSSDTSLIESVTLNLATLFFDKKDTCQAALAKAAGYGDQAYKAVAWGVESGSNRLFVRRPDRNSVRYVIDPAYAHRVSARGDTTRDFATEAWARYGPERTYTAKYYAHVTPAGIIANTTATGDDLASVVYGVKRDAVVELSDISAPAVAAQMLQAWLIEHAHPQVSSRFAVFGPVADLMAGGALIQPYELQMGWLCQIPWFRASEAEGAAGADLRDWETTFMLAGMEWNDDSATATLYPEGAAEDMDRMVSYARLLAQETASAETA